MSEEAKAKVKSYFQVVSAHQIDLWVELLTTDYVHHDANLPGGGQTSRAEHMQAIAPFITAFPDCKLTVEDMISEGDKVAARWTFSGTHKAEFMGIAPTNKEMSFQAFSVHRIVGSRIAEAWVNFDAMGLMQQLGVIPE